MKIMNQYNKEEQRQNRAEMLDLTNLLKNEEIAKCYQMLINQAKRRQRPLMNISQWDKNKYFQRNPIQRLRICQDQIERVELSKLSKQIFQKRCLRHKEPIIIAGCTQTWNNQQFWTYKSLLARLGSYKFKVGEDDDGNKIKMPLNIFMKYLVTNTDDSPLYLFEDITMKNKQTQEITDKYEVASIFNENLLELLQLDDRPAFKWLLIGPERSGSGIHVDPILTCAWNTSLIGCKRWVLFDGKAPEHIVTGKQFKKQYETDEPMDYFLKILPQIKSKYDCKQFGLRQFIQKPEQTVFVPGGVWHAVLNLDDTIAVTQNFVSSVNLQQSWPAFMQQRGQLVVKMLNKLKQHNQQLYQRVANLSKQSSQWKQTFGLKYERENTVINEAFIAYKTYQEPIAVKIRSLSSPDITSEFKQNSKLSNSRSLEKRDMIFTDQSWFQ